MNREILIRKLHEQSDSGWDVIIIGGGATGLGIALDSATRGYKTLLLEQSDFAHGTSSRSTKLVHGGVRYLAQGDILLVIEALKERGRMLKNAPHLTSNQEFVIPVYRKIDVLIYYLGLKFYDILAGRLSLGRSYFISAAEVARRLPLVKQDGLKGGIVYHDGQFDDSRMVFSLAEKCVEEGGIVMNYFGVEELVKDPAGKISGVVAADKVSGEKIKLGSKLVINATGVFADGILQMDDPGTRQIIRPSQGVHIVLDKSFLGGNSAIMIPRTDDGRVLFAIPWYDKVVVGTTDTPLDEISREPEALDQEIDFILSTAERYLVRPPEKKDILSVFAGLRPLASDPGNPESTKEISRRHKIIFSVSGLLTVTGGKWTSYRRMAEETLDRAVKAGILEKSECKTKGLSLGSIPGEILSGHLRVYGEKAAEIAALISDYPDLADTLCPDLPYTKAEIIWICRNEMPVNIEDILSRRTRTLLLDARASIKVAPAVAAIMAAEFGFDKSWQDCQVKLFSKLAKNYLKETQ